MVGETARGRVRGSLAVVGLLAAFALASPAQAQSRPDYRNAGPQQLVSAWKTAPRGDRGEIVAALIARRGEALPVLRNSARSGDAAEKFFACSMIAELRDRDGVDALVQASSDGDVRVRRRAATALRILVDRRSAVRLRELLQSESDPGVLATALAALGRLGLRRDVSSIAPFLTHGDENARVVAAGALAILGDERGLDLVLQSTTSADPGAQQSATYALGFFRAAAAGARLQAILDDPNGVWKSYALIAQTERALVTQSATEQIATLDGLAHGRSRTAAEWAVDRLTDIGNADAVAVLRKVRDRQTPVGALAERRLAVLGALP